MKSIKTNKSTLLLIILLIISLVAIGYYSCLLLNFFINKNAGRDLDDDKATNMFYILFGSFIAFQLLLIPLNKFIFKNKFIIWFLRIVIGYLYFISVYVLVISNEKHMSSKFTSYGIILLTNTVILGQTLYKY